jgi:hypothetical protein
LDEKKRLIQEIGVINIFSLLSDKTNHFLRNKKLIFQHRRKGQSMGETQHHPKKVCHCPTQESQGSGFAT